MTEIPSWTLEAGAVLSRRDRRLQYGGAPHGGIEQSAQSLNVFIYSDPSAGAAYGYNYDGWNEDFSIFLYTGEGRAGEQEMTHGNRAILTHKEDGRALRLFVADGFEPGSRTKIQRYVGEFELDDALSYTRAPSPDIHRNMRSAIVFRLRPIGNVLRRESDKSTSGDAPQIASAALVEVETQETDTYEAGGSGGVTAERRESKLVQRYTEFLRAAGHEVRRWRIRPPGELRDLLTDLYDTTEGELYEAKGVTTRDAIRRAIGQLLDYRRHIPQQPTRLAVLLPARPSQDLLSLLTELHISCVYEEPPGNFNRYKPLDE
jgi:hypothetical protein